MQTCIWPSGFHCYSLSLAPVKSRLVLPFWYQLTRVVPGKGPLNGCVYVSVCLSVCVFSRCELLSYTADCSTLLSRVDSLLSECQQRQSASQQQHYTELTVRSAPSPLITARIQSISQSCIFRVVQVTKSLQDPLEVGNNLPGIGDTVKERGLEQKCF